VCVCMYVSSYSLASWGTLDSHLDASPTYYVSCYIYIYIYICALTLVAWTHFMTSPSAPYIYMYIYIYTYIYIYICIYILYKCICIYIYICVCVCVYICSLWSRAPTSSQVHPPRGSRTAWAARSCLGLQKGKQVQRRKVR